MWECKKGNFVGFEESGQMFQKEAFQLITEEWEGFITLEGLGVGTFYAEWKTHAKVWNNF